MKKQQIRLLALVIGGIGWLGLLAFAMKLAYAAGVGQ